MHCNEDRTVDNGDGSITLYPEAGEHGPARTYRKATRPDLRPGDVIEVDGLRFTIMEMQFFDRGRGLGRMVLERV
jgi:hypothetical protein